MTSIETEILDSLSEVDRNYLSLGEKNRKWTNAIKNAVGDVGQRHQYVVYASECKFRRNGEWMFDLTWSKESRKNGYKFRLPLVLESEWDPKDIRWDFSKLLVARADLRVMVFWGHTKEKAENMLDDMLEQIGKYEGSAIGDRYMFIYWTDIPEKLIGACYKIY
jgi:hypothetical protein